MLKALVPVSGSYDPLAAQSTQMQQSGGLAASVAGLFFGNPVALAAGGAALFSNLKTVLFPNTEFRSAFAQNTDRGNLALCTKSGGVKARTRSAYLWAYKVPQYGTPSLALAKSPNLALGMKSTLELKLGKNTAAKELPLARDWRLVSTTNGNPFPVTATITAAGALEVDLSKAKAPPDDYQLAYTWDWAPLQVAGTVHVHPADDFSQMVLAPAEHDKLIEGSGTVTVELRGPDFEFLQGATLVSSARNAKAAPVEFALPLGKGGGPQNVVAVDIDTAKRGDYTLAFTQSDGVARKAPITILPPSPKVSNLPLRLNAGETKQLIRR